MIRLLLYKISSAFAALWGVASLVFFLFTVLPGDPAQMMLDQNEDSAQLAIIKSKFGFDLPISTQYFYYLNDVLIVLPNITPLLDLLNVTLMYIYLLIL